MVETSNIVVETPNFVRLVLAVGFFIIVLGLCIYLTTIPRNVQIPEYKLANIGLIANNKLHVYELCLKNSRGMALICKRNIMFIDAVKRKQVTHIVMLGETFEVRNVGTEGYDDMVVTLRKINYGIFKARGNPTNTFTTIPNTPMVLHILGYNAL